MHNLLILSRRAQEYRALVEAAVLPDLAIVAAENVGADPCVGPGRTPFDSLVLSLSKDELAQDRRGSAPTISDIDVVLGEPSLLRGLLARLPALRWAQSTWAGVEPLLDPSLRRDYVLTNARGVFGPQMSEYVFGYLIARERLMFEKHAAQREGRWDPSLPGTLRGKLLGLLGVGSIGAALARTAKHFGMRVKGYTRASEGCPDVDAYFHGDDLQAFAADLDYLVSIMPNTAATRHLVDARLLAALPARAVFVNPGRGTAVDETALAEALAAGRLAGAVLDVFHQEPLPPDHVFWRTPNVIITSHTAAVSLPEDIAPVFIENYKRWIAGESLNYQVDFERGY